MTLLPGSIRTRTILVLLIGLTLSHLASTVVYSGGPDRDAQADPLDRLAALSRVVAAVPVPRRADLVQAASQADLHVVWDQASDHGVVGPAPARVQAAFPGLDGDRLKVAQSHPPSTLLSFPHLFHAPPGSWRQIAVGLEDGSWLVAHVLEREANPVSRSLLSTLVMLAGTVVMAVWATGWITAPLAAFTRAAEKLGTDVGGAPLAEDGPKEMKAAAHAFNLMQRRIRSFVDDRLQFVAAVSHDLRTPITRLRLRTEQLPIDPGQQKKMLDDLNEMEQMVASSMAFARDAVAEEPRQAFDLAALLGTLCDDMADAGHDVAFDWRGRLVFTGRPLAMKRLFANLLENAVRYGNRARVEASAAAAGLSVTVSDDGPGIPEAQMETAFRPFVRLEGSRNRKRAGGLGLGLATARSIARAHGGDVLLANRPGGGLVATVQLPLAGRGEA
jgi:signal transduction histidine kinase